MSDESAEKRIQRELVQDTEDIVVDNLERVKRLLRLNTDGKVYVKEVTKDFGTQNKILVQLIGKLYAKTAGLAESETLETGEIADKIGANSKAVSARLSDLREKGWVESPSRGTHRLEAHRLETILTHLEP